MCTEVSIKPRKGWRKNRRRGHDSQRNYVKR